MWGLWLQQPLPFLRHEHSKSHGFFQNYYELTIGLEFFSHLFPPFTHNYQQQRFIHIHESTNKYICTIINLERKNGCLDAHWPHLWQVLTVPARALSLRANALTTHSSSMLGLVLESTECGRYGLFRSCAADRIHIGSGIHIGSDTFCLRLRSSVRRNGTHRRLIVTFHRRWRCSSAR